MNESTSEQKVIDDILEVFSHAKCKEDILEAEINPCIILIKDGELDFSIKLKGLAEPDLGVIKTEDMMREWIKENVWPEYIKVGKMAKESDITNFVFMIASQGKMVNKEEYDNMSEVDKFLVKPECNSEESDLILEFHVIDIEKKQIDLLVLKVNITADGVEYNNIHVSGDSTFGAEFVNRVIDAYDEEIEEI